MENVDEDIEEQNSLRFEINSLTAGRLGNKIARRYLPDALKMLHETMQDVEQPIPIRMKAAEVLARASSDIAKHIDTQSFHRQLTLLRLEENRRARGDVIDGSSGKLIDSKLDFDTIQEVS